MKGRHGDMLARKMGFVNFKIVPGTLSFLLVESYPSSTMYFVPHWLAKNGSTLSWLAFSWLRQPNSGLLYSSWARPGSGNRRCQSPFGRRRDEVRRSAVVRPGYTTGSRSGRSTCLCSICLSRSVCSWRRMRCPCSSGVRTFLRKTTKQTTH